MGMSILRRLFLAPILIVAILLPSAQIRAAGPLLIAYGGHNETMAPLWVGIEKGLSSYKVTRLQMSGLDVVPNPQAWKRIQRLLTRVNPKVQEADLEQLLVTHPARHLEESGFLPEMRKRLVR